MENIKTKNNSFNIGNNTIGEEHVFIIAEACDNHLGNMDIASKMIVEAKLAGADCIKFQHHLPDEEMLPDTPMPHCHGKWDSIGSNFLEGQSCMRI